MAGQADRRTVDLDHLVDGLEVEELDALLHELHAPPSHTTRQHPSMLLLLSGALAALASSPRGRCRHRRERT